MKIQSFVLSAFVSFNAVSCVVNTTPAGSPEPYPASPGAPPPSHPAQPAAAPAPAPAAPAQPAAAVPAPAPAPAATPAAPAPAYAETPEPSEAPKEIRFSVADGRPKGLVRGAFEAFWVWHDLNGKHWHVRSTTHSTMHRFQGSVIGEGGKLTDIHPTRTEWGDRIRANARGVSFDFHTNGDEDGFDFKVSGTHCVRMYLLIDGKPDPARINVGASDAHPPAWHFKVCP